MFSLLFQNSHFEIYDLRFDCRYNVKAQPVCEGDKVGAVAHATFHTPSCGEVTVYGNIEPDCPTNGECDDVGKYWTIQNFQTKQSHIYRDKELTVNDIFCANWEFFKTMPATTECFIPLN